MSESFFTRSASRSTGSASERNRGAACTHLERPAATTLKHRSRIQNREGFECRCEPDGSTSRLGRGVFSLAGQVTPPVFHEPTCPSPHGSHSHLPPAAVQDRHHH